jgi:hypothetical protein
MAAVSKAFVNLLSANLANVQVPAGYDALRQKLMTMQPKRGPSTIKESPENSRRIESVGPKKSKKK